MRPRKPMNRRGKKTREWESVRRRLAVKFTEMGITTCELGYEGCRRNDYLSWAHGRKRRHLVGDELESLVILACQPCHQQIERLFEEDMCSIVMDVIEARKVAR